MMNSRSVLWKCAVVSGVLLTAVPSFGSTIAAENIPVASSFDYFGAGIFAEAQAAQSFTVGVSGTLDSIELPIFREQGGSPSSGLIVAIWGVTPNGVPDEANVLASSIIDESVFAEFPYGSQPSFLSVDFSADTLGFAIDLNAGDQYAIVLLSETTTFPAWYLWAGNFDADNYTEGQYFFRTSDDPAWVFNPNSGDLGFRVNVSAVPIPAAFSLLASGLTMLVAMRRKNRGSNTG